MLPIKPSVPQSATIRFYTDLQKSFALLDRHRFDFEVRAISVRSRDVKTVPRFLMRKNVTSRTM